MNREDIGYQTRTKKQRRQRIRPESNTDQPGMHMLPTDPPRQPRFFSWQLKGFLPVVFHNNGTRTPDFSRHRGRHACQRGKMRLSVDQIAAAV